MSIGELRRKLEVAKKRWHSTKGYFMPLKPDSSYTGLDEFAVKPVVENKSSKEETKAIRKNLDAPMVKEWVLDDEEKNVAQPKIVKKTVKPSIPKIEFVKPRQQEKTARKNIKKGTKDEISGILNSFITRIENLVDHMVKVIRCDNGTEFKNKEMNQFCEMKGKFDRKVDEGFFVRYSLNNKAFRVFNRRTRIVEENLQIRFSESTTNVVGSGPDWLFDIDALTRTINYELIVAGTQSNGFAGIKASDNVDPKSSYDDGFKPSSDEVHKVVEEVVEDINTTKLIVNAAQVNAAGEINAASIATTNSVAAIMTAKEVTLAKPLTEDKGKGIMVEEPVKPKKKEKIRLDEEAVLKLQAELQAEFKEEQILAREKAQKELEANIALIET
nr:ribonuclease H-like domain-containing protein [Tanacetum cinerariifolium]